VSQLKREVYNLCQDYINTRIHTVRTAMDTAQASANDETKSSAGDKYETGRAMMQLELEKNSVQLAEANKLRQTLIQLDPDKHTDIVQMGSLVTTNHGLFYLSISAGQLKLKETIVFAVSHVSPVGAKLAGLKKGDSFQLNGKEYTIQQVE
jgi:transcription elongation GreA/GreB family factor